MYLSFFKYSDILFKFTDEEIEKIVFNQYDKITKADIGIVLGGTSMIPSRADKAIELYKAKKIKKILVSGGVGYLNLKRNVTEAKLLKDYLLKHGVLNTDILIEDRSRNTYENFLYSYELLKDTCNLKSTTFTLITSCFHMKRASGLFKYFFKDSLLYTCSVYDGRTDKNLWKNSFYGKRIVKQEALLLKYYIKSLKIADIKIK